jgi:zinc protease
LVFNRRFGGAFGSRLNLNLRERKGYTYGARSIFRRWREAGYFGLFADVKTETTRGSVDEMFSELRALCASRPLTRQERDEAVSGLLLGFPGQFERINGVAARLSTLPVYLRPADWYTRWPERVQLVDVDAVNRAASKHCDPQQYVVVLAGDRARVEPELKGLGLPVIHHDPQGRRLQ